MRVAGIDGMTLEVEPCPDKSMIPRQVPPSPRRTPIFNAACQPAQAEEMDMLEMFLIPSYRALVPVRLLHQRP